MIDNEYYRFCVDFSPAENDHASESKIEFIKKLENEQQSCKFKKHHTETILQEIENLALLLHQKTVRQLRTTDIGTLSRYVIESIRISSEKLHFNLFFKDFMTKETI